ncbi:MAG: hypothetical protein U1F43_16970 [Myxococcota bacterium]
MSTALASTAATPPKPETVAPEVIPIDLAATLDGFGSRLPEVLVPAPARDALVAFTRGLPPLFQWVMLEHRLTGPADARVDLLASLIDAGGPASSGARAAIGRTVASAAGHPALAGVRLLEPWCQGGDLAAVHVLWLEGDAPYGRVPLQMVSVDRRFWGPRDGPRPTPAEQVALAAAGYRHTFGAPHDAGILAGIERAIALLPASASAIFAASLRPRGVDVDRLFVEVPREGVLPWLAAIGWPGDRDAARAWLGDVVAPWEPAYLQVELGPGGVGPYLGIEPRQTGGMRSERRERRRFLERLVADGRTSADKVAALLAWEGEARVLGPGGARRELRSFHLKCVSTAGERPEVKAYLGFHYRPLAPGLVR